MSRLSQVKSGRLSGALRYLFYGIAGVGKTTLASDALNPIFLDCEDGTGLIDCARYPFRDEPGGHVAQSYQELLDAIDDLITGEHNFQSVVIDTLDRVEALLWAHICERDSRNSNKTYKSIVDYGYGKGFEVAVDEWRALCGKLDQLRARRNVTIILLAHAQIRRFGNPEGEDYDRYSLRVHEKASGFLRGWVDVLGFCCYEGGAAKHTGEDKIRGYSTGLRHVRFQREAAYDAKSRLPTPDPMVIAPTGAWSVIQAAEDLVGVIEPAPTQEYLI
ncbi:MAG: ATP-binding protein, partial [Myxococcota bacterium]